MKVAYEADGTPRITAYEQGDLVRLTRNERGEDAMGRAGDWGRVEDRTRAGLLTIRIAGYCRPNDWGIARLTDISPSMVEPCDRRGASAPLKPLYVRAVRVGSTRAVAARGVQWRLWAAVAVVSSCVLIAVVSAGIAAK